tara:strand:+ start:398 stop:916 length:519 start_codon:yes stop_codon:yes gene_type:complete
MSLKLYTDKTEVFECNVELTGVPMNQSSIRAILEFNDKKLLVDGNISSSGEASITLPKLKNLANEGQVGKMVLEVIADDAYFKPYEETFSVLTSKKATVEVKKIEQVKPKVVIEKVTPISTIVEMLKDNGITKKDVYTNKSKFSKVLYNYYQEANINESYDNYLKNIISRLD